MKEMVLKIKQIVNFTLASISAFLLSTMAILVIYQVFTRYVLSDPSDWTQEVIRYLLIWTGFIGAAYAFGTRQHMALTYFRDKLDDEKRKWALFCVDAMILLFALFVMVIGGTQLALSVRGVTSALLEIPRSLVYAMGPISGVFIVFIQIVNLWEDYTGEVLEKVQRKQEQLQQEGGL
jgi:TRAP-type C4-dicarboxylate transport system permease small subunit